MCLLCTNKLPFTVLHSSVALRGQASHNALLPLKLLQKRIIRIMTNSGFRDLSLPLFAKLNILQVDDAMKLEVAKLMHTVLRNDKPQFKTLKLSAQIHGYQTCHSTQLNYFSNLCKFQAYSNLCKFQLD